MLTGNAGVSHSFASTQHPDEHIRRCFLWLQRENQAPKYSLIKASNSVWKGQLLFSSQSPLKSIEQRGAFYLFCISVVQCFYWYWFNKGKYHRCFS